MVRKRGVAQAADSHINRCLLDIQTWKVPANFVSYAPTFFAFPFIQGFFVPTEVCLELAK